MIIGTHMSVAKGLEVAAKNTVWMNANTMQIFSRNPRGSNYKTYEEEEVEAFRTNFGTCTLYHEPCKCQTGGFYVCMYGNP